MPLLQDASASLVRSRSPAAGSRPRLPETASRLYSRLMSRPDRLVAALTIGAIVVAAAACAIAYGLDADAQGGAGLVLVVAAVAAGLALTARPSRLDPSDEVTARLARIEDEIVAAREERYRMRMRAETAGRFREEFVAAVRHELRTPLNAILGFAGVLLQEVDGELAPTQREDVEQIRAAGEYLEELVDAVLSEWHPDRQTPLPARPIDAAAIFERVTRILEGQRRRPEVSLRWHVAEDFVAPRADPRRLVQVLMNLGTNALRATESGSIRFEARNDGDEAVLAVIDTGRGIAADRLDAIFEAFEQGESAGSAGAGLGLAIARELVEWHDGRIEVSSEPGRGSTFAVHLPRTEVP